MGSSVQQFKCREFDLCRLWQERENASPVVVGDDNRQIDPSASECPQSVAVVDGCNVADQQSDRRILSECNSDSSTDDTIDAVGTPV